MRRGRTGLAGDASVLEAALIGFEQMRRTVEEKTADIRRQLGSGRGATAGAAGKTRRRTLSAAARRKIAAAQRKRWAQAKAKQTKPKRAMSAAARKKIAGAQRKRWAALKKAHAKAGRKRTASKKAANKEGQTAAS